MAKLTKDSNREEILKAFNSRVKKVIQNNFYIKCEEVMSNRYKHVDGYFFKQNNYLYWTLDPTDIELDDEGIETLINKIWLMRA